MTIFSNAMKAASPFKTNGIRLASYLSKALTVKQFGNPLDSLSLESSTIKCTEPSQVVVHMLYSPINPADINTIQGVYAVKPQIPFVCGNEGIGRVVESCKSDSKLKKGDLVVPRKNALGTWRDYVVASEDDWLKVPSDLSPVTLATLMVNPGTAYRMLTDFVDLKPGSVVIQFCRVKHGEPERDFCQKLPEHTSNLVTLQLRSTEVFKSKEIPAPSLALNCVGGRNALELIKTMGENSTMVTYGGMSKQPLTVPTAALIFKDITLKGFWMTRWNWLHDKDGQREHLVNELCSLAKQGVLQSPPHTLVHIDSWITAIEGATDSRGLVGTKYILSFEA
ncbi:enoyl-[acyl-carrier-protein] reductase, mitochondrial-like isoform X2 [Artemia franciscana]|uniref:enoyl-[acyl-carrier-protein] reductase, mitochondrial-like isoform X2 n=1 Tax=Artemia franciscana TaxID=6661 RepID=UPI0032DB7C83